MACYKKFEECEDVWIEQNIFDDEEIRSFDATYEVDGIVRKVCLYYYEAKDGRFYQFNLEQTDRPELVLVTNELEDVLKFNTAKKRRSGISKLISDNEKRLLS